MARVHAANLVVTKQHRLQRNQLVEDLGEGLKPVVKTETGGGAVRFLISLL